MFDFFFFLHIQIGLCVVVPPPQWQSFCNNVKSHLHQEKNEVVLQPSGVFSECLKPLCFFNSHSVSQENVISNYFWNPSPLSPFPNHTSFTGCLYLSAQSLSLAIANMLYRLNCQSKFHDCANIKCVWMLPFLAACWAWRHYFKSQSDQKNFGPSPSLELLQGRHSSDSFCRQC